MKNTKKFLFVFALSHLLASCDGDLAMHSSSSIELEETSIESETSEGISTSEESIPSEETSESQEEETTSSEQSNPASDFISTEGGTFSIEGNTITISAHGVYVLTGSYVGQIYIDAPESDSGAEEVELSLNNATLTYGENSPIYCISADKLKIKAEDGTKNEITDIRALETEEIDTQGGGAIYSKVDTNFVGKGTLKVTGGYNNGIHVTKDLKIKNQKLTVQAPNNAIKGNDSLGIESGTINAISTGGDGLKTSDSDISSKGKQRGTITISGGTVNIYSACDGIDAAYDTVITGGTVKAFTNKFSNFTDEIVTPASSSMYLRTTTKEDSRYRYALLFSNGEETTWVNATYKTSMHSGRSTYYYYELSRPVGYEYFAIYKFNATAENSTTSYLAKSSSAAVNSYFDTATFTTTSASISIGNWTNYSSQQSGQGGPGGGFGESGNSDKADVSAKGIKAHNSVQISGGTIEIKAYDDGIHANFGDQLENESTGIGDVVISGGNISIDASDDGIHAERTLSISEGKILISNSYEGLEDNQIKVSGGHSFVNAKDDGVNASLTSGTGLSALITVSGGVLDVNASPSGDTDGIDSNGRFVVTGGVVIAKGPNSTNMAAVDTDQGVSITGRTLVSFGRIADTPSTSGVTYSYKSGTYSTGTKTLTYANGETIVTELKYTYTNCYSYSVNGALNSVA